MITNRKLDSHKEMTSSKNGKNESKNKIIFPLFLMIPKNKWLLKLK